MNTIPTRDLISNFLKNPSLLEVQKIIYVLKLLNYSVEQKINLREIRTILTTYYNQSINLDARER